MILQSTIDAMIQKSKVETRIINHQFFSKIDNQQSTQQYKSANWKNIKDN